MRRYLRAYPAISSRQQGADRLVYNETDLRTVLWQAVDPAFEGERPSTIRLAADIYLTKPIELGAYQYNVSIEGGGKFAIAEGSTFIGTYLFGLPSGSISDVDFIGVTFTTDNVALLFNGSGLTAVDDFIFEECALQIGVPLMMFQPDIVITSTRIDFDDYPAAHSFVVQAGGTGNFTGVLSVGPYLTQYESNIPIIARTNDGVGCKEENPQVSLDVNGGFRLQRADILTLSGLDPVIDTTDRSFFEIEIDSTASGYIQMTTGYSGQIAILKFETVSGSATSQLHDISSAVAPLANIRVNKNHKNKVPNSHELVTFIYAGSEWAEMARSENT